MKKFFYNAILLLLAFCTVLSCFSCASNTSEVVDTQSVSDTSANTDCEETTDSGLPPMEKKNYACDYNVLYCKDTFGEIEYFFAEEESGFGVSDYTYERSLYVADYLGVTIKTVNGGDWLAYFPVMKNGIKSGDDMYQLVLTHPHGSIADMIKSGYSVDFNEFSSINLDRDYWNKSLMDEVSLNDSRYLGYGDLLLADTQLIAFNKEMYNNHSFDNPYELVDNREWTLEKFLSIASQISVDVTGNGKSQEDDTFGITGWGWVPIVSFMTGCNVKVADKDSDGDVYISLDKDYGEKFSGITEIFKDVFKAEYTFLYPIGYSGEYPEIDSGRTLFSLLSNKAMIYYAGSTVGIGVLPYPLYDTNQTNYKSLSWNGYMVIPSSVLNYDMVGDTTELLMFLSESVKTAYFEVLLGARLANAKEDAHMLDIIWASQVTDIGLTYCSTSENLETLFYALPRIGNSNVNYASFTKKIISKSEAKLKDFFK